MTKKSISEKTRIEYYESSFFDFLKQEHKFVIAAYSHFEDGQKVVSLGVAFTHPEDKYNAGLGKSIALTRAKTSDYKLVASHPGMISYGLVNQLLQQEAFYISQNPGKYIKGYTDAEKKYKKNKAKEAAFSKLDKADKETVSIKRDLDEFIKTQGSPELKKYLNDFYN